MQLGVNLGGIQTTILLCRADVLLLAALVLTGCTAPQGIGSNANVLRAEIEVGDVLQITTKDMDVIPWFKVTAIRPDGFVGKTTSYGDTLEQVTFDDIAWTERYQFSAAETFQSTVLSFIRVTGVSLPFVLLYLIL